MSAAQPPVFVDDSGRRRILTRRTGRIVVIAFTGYLGLVGLGFARDPRVGPVHLPTFGLPSLGLMVPPAPSVLGEQATRTAADAQPSEAERPTAPTGRAERTTTPSTPAGDRTTTPRPTATAPAGSPAASRATTPTTGLPASNNTSATTSPSSSTTSSTTTTTTSPSPGQGQGQAQRSEAASTKGPDDSGPPGQLRKTTTTTAG